MTLFGCNKNIRVAYSYCVADTVERQILHDQSTWVTRCDGGDYVTFHSRVDPGQTIYYTPYYEDNDLATVHGYVLTDAP